MKLILSIVVITFFQVINSKIVGVDGVDGSCNKDSQVCASGLRCNPDTNKCYQGQSNDKTRCTNAWECANDEVCSTTGLHPGVKYCWKVVKRGLGQSCSLNGREKCEGDLNCAIDMEPSWGWIIQGSKFRICQEPGSFEVPEDSPI